MALLGDEEGLGDSEEGHRVEARRDAIGNTLRSLDEWGLLLVRRQLLVLVSRLPIHVRSPGNPSNRPVPPLDPPSEP